MVWAAHIAGIRIWEMQPQFSREIMQGRGRFGQVCGKIQFYCWGYVHVCMRFILMSSFYFIGLPRGRFPIGYLTKILYAFLVSPTLTTCLALRNILYLTSWPLQMTMCLVEHPHYPKLFIFGAPYFETLVTDVIHLKWQMTSGRTDSLEVPFT